MSWFTDKKKELKKKFKKTIPSLGFVHTPTNASLALQEKGVDPRREPGVNDDLGLAQQSQFWCPDGTYSLDCPYGGQDGAFMEAIVNTDGMMALFSGHDHGNTWCYKWNKKLPGMAVKGDGINICFGQHSGYGGYGNWIRGARQVVVSEGKLADGVLDTYIRLESGAAVAAVSLNSTYGNDLYPVVPDDQTTCPTCM